ncbi:MAG: type IV pilin [Candidatus Bathyarchaeia archaeon]
MNGILRHNQKAVSPVIATIIIVAVAIVMSIAVAYWMLGLATTFTRYEKLEFTAAYATISQENYNYTVTLELKNTGTTTATIDRVLLNGIPLNDSISVNIDPQTISPGGSCKIEIELPKGEVVNGALMASGISIELIVTSAAGNQYPKTVVLP